MSNKFEAGKTYKLNPIMIFGLDVLMQTQYSGEEGVFTVAEITEEGHAYTDDITSPNTTDRCLIPADTIVNCEVVNG